MTGQAFECDQKYCKTAGCLAINLYNRFTIISSTLDIKTFRSTLRCFQCMLNNYYCNIKHDTDDVDERAQQQLVDWRRLQKYYSVQHPS